MNVAWNILDIIRGEDEGRYNYIWTLQKLPVIFWLDIHLRRRTLYKESESLLEIIICVILPLCLLILRKRALSYVYNMILCALFMKITLPFLQNIQKKRPMFRVPDIPSLIQEEKHLIRIYVMCGIFFLCTSLCISAIKLIVEKVYSSRQHLLVLGLLLGINYLVKYLCPTIPILKKYDFICLGFQQFFMTMFAIKLFQIEFYVFLTLTLTLSHLLAYDIPFYSYIILGSILIQHFDIRNLMNNIKSQLIIHQLNKSVLRERMFFEIFSYTYVAIIGILYDLYKTNHKEETMFVILHKTFTILCTTISGTACYIIFIIYLYLGIIYFVLWFLENNFKHEPIDESSVLVPAAVLIFVASQTFKVGYAQHGSAMLIGLFLIAAPLLEDIHKRAEPVLLSLGTSGGSSVQNFKALCLFIALITLPIIVVVYIFKSELSNHLGIFWTLVVTSSFLSLSVAALGSVLLYALLAYDTYRSEPLQCLDEIMYWIRGIVGICEVGIGILNICYLGWNITAIQWSWFYFLVLAANIFTTYDKVKTGWTDFQQRRLAVKRLSFLSNATNEQLLQNDDVCAICLRSMTSAKVTPCKHLFHESCLKRWSYIKETCPLCNKIINIKWLFQRILTTIRQEMGNVQRN